MPSKTIVAGPSNSMASRAHSSIVVMRQEPTNGGGVVRSLNHLSHYRRVGVDFGRDFSQK